MDEVDRLAAATKLAEHLCSGTISLYDIVGRVLEKQSGTDPILIVVDQFEERTFAPKDGSARSGALCRDRHSGAESLSCSL